jgi:hypothetical protein
MDSELRLVTVGRTRPAASPQGNTDAVVMAIARLAARFAKRLSCLGGLAAAAAAALW